MMGLGISSATFKKRNNIQDIQLKQSQWAKNVQCERIIRSGSISRAVMEIIIIFE